MKNLIHILFISIATISFLTMQPCPFLIALGDTKPAIEEEIPDYYMPYLEFLEEVYNKMDQYYYKPISKDVYDTYVEKYKRSVLSKIGKHDKKINRIAHIGAGLMVNHLKDRKEDNFTNFIPPKEAKEYAKKVYGYENGIGITGTVTEKGYKITHVQIRSDAYKKGISSEDIVLKINDFDILSLSEEDLNNYLFPPLETIIKLEILSYKEEKTKIYKVVCEEYFKETITNISTNTPRVFCLKIHTFNRKTSDDFKEYIKDFTKKDIDLLIIDLTDNPGGPPLAVHELSGIFFPPETKLVYYKKREAEKFGLISPESNIHYDGKVAILVNKMSGSASEILAGTMKAYKRAIVVGKESTAGRAFLKSTFNFEDGSMLAMVTGFAYLADGTKFGMEGVSPNVKVPMDADNMLLYIIDKYKENALAKPSLQ